MNRIDRLTAMIIYLQGRSFTSVQELSERYGVSSRTVYRDLAALQESGVPIGSEPDKGYFIVKGYHLPPVMFSRKEAVALLAAERLMSKWKNSILGAAFNTALNKIRAVLPHPDKEYFETLEQHIAPYPMAQPHTPHPDIRYFEELQKAIVQKELVEISYYSFYNQERSRREVEPLGLLVLDNYWYLASWCRKRADYRTFRLDRIESCHNTGRGFGSEHTLREYYELSLQQEKNVEEIVILFNKEMIKFLGDQKYRHGWVWEKEVDNGVEVTFLYDHSEYFCRWLLIWGDGITILKPDHIKEKVEALVRELQQHYLHQKVH